ncbi:Signal transduction histidine kinase [Marinobacter segnicrescens]|uniref:histidine kinase n=1 Tax=Marinobacter segnicrescens TaxID=430453 RepID=A0A1H9ZRU9_9GAMM|nr:HAMP domain-containing sensor histidine kinase [Marinobacter segnicrescens]SES84506.1 Signal transduction histidine kinase [Marinobacter segnicrescens]
MMQPDVARDSPHDNRIRELEAENARLRKIRDSLIAHVESGTGRTPDPYAVFEHSVMLAEQVRERTEALNQLMDDLRESNSALEQARAEAEQANHSKSRFLAAVSHDLLQPLNAARLFTGALEEQGLEGTAASLVRSLGSSLEAVDHLLGTLVDISRLDAGVIEPDPSSFDLADLLDGLAQEFSQLAADKGLAFRYVATKGRVWTDSRLLARVLRNFFSNALRYTDAGGILMGCRRRDRQLEIQVWDTGPGIEAHQLADIFQEFRRARPGDAPPDAGLGLGLAIVDRIATLLDHPVTVASRPGKGSRFAIAVPLVSAD